MSEIALIYLSRNSCFFSELSEQAIFQMMESKSEDMGLLLNQEQIGQD